MAFSTFNRVLFIFSSVLWVADTRKYNAVLTVPNGGRWGQWGHAQFCPKGHVVGFQLKMEPYGREYDLTALNGIALLCDDGKIITSTAGPWGILQKVQVCQHGHLIGFKLRVEEEIRGDNTAVNNIACLCSDNTIIFGRGLYRGSFGRTSNRCRWGSICGIQTKVQPPQLEYDDTALNDVRMFCCD